MHSQTQLHSWSFRKGPSHDEPDPTWTRCKHDRPATQLYLDLQDAGLIPDPFVRRNAMLDSIQEPSVDPNGYEYKLSFSVDAENLKHKHHDLVFEGLDTLAEVYLNDKHILSSNNMFQTHRVGVAHLLRPEGDNELKIHFSSTILRGREIEKERGKLHCFNGEPARLYIRQAQHQWGWDWQPTLVTYGPYRPIKLESYQARLEDVHFAYNLNEELTKADLKITYTLPQIVSGSPDNLKAEMTVFDGSDKVVSASQDITSDHFQPTFSLGLEKPKLWWPWRYGTPHLYRFELNLVEKDSGTVVDTFTKDIGLRSARVIQEPLTDQSGTSFYFEINNTPVFANGSNWIPGHAFEAAIDDNAYADWIDLSVKGNQDMIRVWGGGNYLRDVFYEECDRRGLMIWQDFMFACGQYPCYPAFEESVRIEATQQVKRLRNFCSIVIFAGNNEDYQVAEQDGLTWDKDDHSGDYRDTDFPARTLYETVLPNIVKGHAKIAYHPGSPWGGNSIYDQTVGDVHAWSVWHGDQLPYQTGYTETAGRFVSEFGNQSLPSNATIDSFMKGADNERFIQSKTFEFHNNADSWERRLALYIFENVKLASVPLEDWRYASQLMQAESTTYAYRAFRHGWQGDKKRYVGGGLIWQTNDAWPCVSWSIVDFDRRPKLAYYAVKRECADVALDFSRSAESYDVWVLSSALKECKDATLELHYYDLNDGSLKDSTEHKVTVPINKSSKMLSVAKLHDPESTLVAARLVKDKAVICRAYDWPQPLKYLPVLSTKVDVKVVNDHVEVATNVPVNGVELWVPNQPDVLFDDNGFDLTPKDGVVKVKVSGLSGDLVSARWYNQSSTK